MIIHIHVNMEISLAIVKKIALIYRVLKQDDLIHLYHCFFSRLASKNERIPIGIIFYRMLMILKILSFVLNHLMPMKFSFRIFILKH